MTTRAVVKRMCATLLAAAVLCLFLALPAHAQTYNCGTYGGGDYSECTTPSTNSSPSPSTTTSNNEKEPDEQKPAEDTESAQKANVAESSSVWKYVGIGGGLLLVLIALIWAMRTKRGGTEGNNTINL